jgi:chemotaxis protein histidine kinase CheA
VSDDETQILRPSNMLRAKLGTSAGPSLDQIVARAEAALGDLSCNYEEWIRDYLASINAALADARAGAPPSPDAIDRIRRASHEIKGQGETFGYPLLTQVGHMLYTLIDRDEERAARHLELIAAHIDFMNLVVKDGVHDQGGPQEQQILSALDTATQKLSNG